MPPSKTKSSRATISRKSTLSLHCKINNLPIKAMQLSLSYVMAKAKTSKKISMMEFAKAQKTLKGLDNVSTRLKSNEQIDPNEFYGALDNACAFYVNFYYGMDNDILNAIIEEHRSAKKNLDGNILTMPAIAVMKKEPKTKTIVRLKKNIYKKPIVFLHNTLKSSRSIESLRVAISLNESKVNGTQRLSYLLTSLEKNILTSNPESQDHEKEEDFKRSIINSIVILSDQYGMHTLNYVNDKLDEATFNIKSAQRVIRQ